MAIRYLSEGLSIYSKYLSDRVHLFRGEHFDIAIGPHGAVNTHERSFKNFGGAQSQ